MKTLTMDINGECNLNCEFCYQGLDGNILNNSQIFDIMREKMDFDVVELGGGEPFLHKELDMIIANLIKLNKKINISTNAAFIPKAILNLEKSLRNNVTMQISLHASNKDAYESIAGYDYFDNVLKNTGILKQLYKSSFNAVIYNKNFNQVKDILSIAYGLGMPIRVSPVMPVGRGRNIEKLSEEQINLLKGALLLEKINGKEIYSPLIERTNCPALNESYGISGAEPCSLKLGKKEYINQKGETFGCEFIRR